MRADRHERMSVIQGPRPSLTGIDTATAAIRRAQERFGAAAAQIARQGASANAPVQAEGAANTRPPAQTPPNPGPPGGAQPADLAQAFVAQNVAANDLAANVKTVQAFSEMLEELSRIKD